MGENVVFLSYPYLTNLVCSVIKERNDPFSTRIIELELNQSRDIIDQLDQDESIQVILTVRGHAHFVKDVKRTAVVIQDVSGDDLLHAYYQVPTGTKEIVVMRYGQKLEEYRVFDRLFPFVIHHDCYDDEYEAREKISLWMKRGIQIFVGTSVVCHQATKMGATSIFLYSKKTIADAFDQAANILDSAKHDRAKLERIKTVIQNADDAILATDARGRVDLVNLHAVRLLKQSEQELVGQQVQNFLPYISWDKVFEKGEGIEHVLTTVKGTQLIFNITPIQVGQENMGCVITFQDVSKVRDAENKIRQALHQKGLVAKYHFSDIVHQSGVMKRVIKRAKLYAETDATILIHGETGTGKELFAQSIHHQSPRANKPFVAVNCSALPESLLESELFGYEEGAFTGARKGGKRGLFELAHGGTLFLDEIGEITPRLQARLLRVLQEKEIMRVGGDAILPVDVRIIAATNKCLKRLVEQGSFREDLYYRLNTLSLHLPPLRERREDIPLIAEKKLKQEGFTKPERKEIIALIQKFLGNHSWKGNVRELESVVQRLVVLYRHSGHQALIREGLRELLVEDNLYLSHNDHPPLGESTTLTLHQVLKKEELEKIKQALQETRGNKALAAEKLGISRTTLWRKLKGVRGNLHDF